MLRVRIGNEQVHSIRDIRITERGRFSIEIPRKSVTSHAGDTVQLTVELLDEDAVSHDVVGTATRETTIPVQPTPSATSTAPRTATPAETLTPQPTDGQADTTPTTSIDWETASDTATATQSPTEAPQQNPPASTPEPTQTPGPDNEWRVTVVEVVDGDTLTVRFKDGHTEDVRLLGVDTPEVNVENTPGEFEGIPDTEDGRDWLRDWGHKASEHARTALAGEKITIRTDDQADRRGSYDRLLVYAEHDGESFNKELLKQGFARLYDSEFSKRDTYANLEQASQSDDIGLWDYEQSTATPSPTPDGDQSGNLEVKRIKANADGDEYENLDDEYVIFENTGQSTIDLRGWTVTDEGDNHAYQFGAVSLEPGATIRLVTGEGEDSSSRVYWGQSAPVWNNGGDTVHVTTDGGKTVIKYTYEDR